MAPQTEIPIAANVLGTIGTVLWCIQLVPQIWTNWRKKKTEGLPGLMMFLWALCGVPFGIYAVVQNFNIPIQIQPQIFMALCLIAWVQILIYNDEWKPWKAILLGLTVAAIFAGIEMALIITIRPIYNRGDDVAVVVIGIVAAVFLGAGLLPPYFELWKRNGRVVGLNWVFLALDWSGAFVSLMALVAQETFDALGGATYITCCVLEIGIFASHVVWWMRSRKIRKEAAAQGKTFDDIAAEYEAMGIGFPFAGKKSCRESIRSADEESGYRTAHVVHVLKKLDESEAGSLGGTEVPNTPQGDEPVKNSWVV